ncbi:hypothetical protein JYU34_013497 [Plutella xylostella]|uniref:Tight junction-associated protein 1 n=1 Tax=Plutella xylostella TaxID=51655 RepID=A0ABQ7Q9X7_PLUXY|nr:hypothetical protein JYU34_013497 [Plutella xylostella]
MDESIKTSPCKECTVREDAGSLPGELDHLRRLLAERDTHIVSLESEFVKCSSKANELEEQLGTWREKYDRLYDSHKRVQKLNQVLEDKLLHMVDKMKSEKSQLTKDIATLSVRLAESKHNYSMLQKENERYKNDMNLAIQLLQCKPDNFVSHKLDNLPVDTQARVSQYVMSKSKPGTPGGSSHSKNGNEIESFDASEYEFNISASLMSKILEDSIQDTVTKHCDTCTCSNSQTKPFCYSDTYYSVATQTVISGEMKNSLCLNCNSDLKSIHSNLSHRSGSPHGLKLMNDRLPIHGLPGPMYIIPQPAVDLLPKIPLEPEPVKVNKEPEVPIEVTKTDEMKTLEAAIQKEVIYKIGEDLKQLRKNNGMDMEPAVHHKLCDRTKTPISSKKSTNSIVNDDLLTKDIPIAKETKAVTENQIMLDNISIRKNSLSSMGAVSRTSSVAKSTSSTYKSNTQVGPGPRFCSLRMQAGSKNILLDNAQPDVPPVLYRRQSKCNDATIFKEPADGIDAFPDTAKNNLEDANNTFDKIDSNIVVESTLVDVHVDNNVKESNSVIKNTPLINPILMNVSSSPLQPLKTHNFSNGSEKNNNQENSVTSVKNNTELDKLLNDFNFINNNTSDSVDKFKDSDCMSTQDKPDLFPPTDNEEVKIFNFDRYEQNKLLVKFANPIRKIDMSKLNSLENTKISKDHVPQGELPKLIKKDNNVKPNLHTVVNVYPNLTQTHLKVNENKKVFTNEQSTSSLSSDDSAAILQKQQLLRVAEWVEQNLEQQNNFNDPLLEDDASFNAKIARRESRLHRLTTTLNELALNMPHPVSKYAKPYTVREDHKKWVHHNNTDTQNSALPVNSSKAVNINNVSKETTFPAECSVSNDKEADEMAMQIDSMNSSEYDLSKNLNDVINGDKEITAEDLARMEYNVKKFLLSGPQWANPESVGRSRRTSSKTETDV